MTFKTLLCAKKLSYKFIFVAIAAFLSFGVSNLHAESITQTRDLSYSFFTYAPSVYPQYASGGRNADLGFDQFDYTLGTLESITLKVNMDYYDLKNRSEFNSFRAPYSFTFAIGNTGHDDVFNTTYSDSVNSYTPLPYDALVWGPNPAYQLLTSASLSNTYSITDFSGFIGNGQTGLFVSQYASGYGIDYYFPGQGNSPFPLTHVFSGSAELTYIFTAPVPEPETFSMLFAGLGLLGFVARRRK